MSLVEKIIVDKIEILESNILQIRTATIIEKDGNEISRNFHRHTLVPGSDLSSEDSKVVSIANTLWTDDVISEYQSRVSGIQL